MSSSKRQPSSTLVTQAVIAAAKVESKENEARKWREELAGFNTSSSQAPPLLDQLQDEKLEVTTTGRLTADLTDRLTNRELPNEMVGHLRDKLKAAQTGHREEKEKNEQTFEQFLTLLDKHVNVWKSLPLLQFNNIRDAFSTAAVTIKDAVLEPSNQFSVAELREAMGDSSEIRTSWTLDEVFARVRALVPNVAKVILLDSHLSDVKQSLASLRDLNKEKKEEVAAAKTQAQADIARLKSQHEQSMETLQKKLSEVQDSLKTVNETNTRLQSEVISATTRADVNQAAVNDDIIRLQRQVNDLESNGSRLSAQLSKREQELSSRDQSLEETRSRLTNLESEIAAERSAWSAEKTEFEQQLADKQIAQEEPNTSRSATVPWLTPEATGVESLLSNTTHSRRRTQETPRDVRQPKRKTATELTEKQQLEEDALNGQAAVLSRNLDNINISQDAFGGRPDLERSTHITKRSRTAEDSGTVTAMSHNTDSRPATRDRPQGYTSINRILSPYDESGAEVVLTSHDDSRGEPHSRIRSFFSGLVNRAKSPEFRSSNKRDRQGHSRITHSSNSEVMLNNTPVSLPMPVITPQPKWRASTAGAETFTRTLDEVLKKLDILDLSNGSIVPAASFGITFPQTAFSAFRDNKGVKLFDQGVMRSTCLTRKAHKTEPQDITAGAREACRHCLYYGEVCVRIEKIGKRVTRVILPVPAEFRQGVTSNKDIRTYMAPSQYAGR